VLNQSEGSIGQTGDQHDGWVVAVEDRAEVAFDRCTGGLVIPPIRHRRLGEPPGQQLEVISG
jgi:hypothetical protein